jgi:hypothetical protein
VSRIYEHEISLILLLAFHVRERGGLYTPHIRSVRSFSSAWPSIKLAKRGA